MHTFKLAALSDADLDIVTGGCGKPVVKPTDCGSDKPKWGDDKVSFDKGGDWDKLSFDPGACDKGAFDKGDGWDKGSFDKGGDWDKGGDFDKGGCS